MSYKFISKQTTFPSFFQYPEFLLNLPISQTGKIIYMLLYDRARLSQKSNYSQNNGMTTRAWTMRDRNVRKYKSADEINYNCEEGESLLWRKRLFF